MVTCRRVAIALLIVCALPLTPAARQGGPKLVVLLAVDQMRGDYIDKYRDQWSAGLKRLVDQGAWFRPPTTRTQHRDVRGARQPEHRDNPRRPRDDSQRVVGPRGERLGRTAPTIPRNS